MEQYPSALLESAVDALSLLPGIGRRTALRLSLYLLRRPVEDSDRLAAAVHALRHGVRYCSVCHNISEEEVCPICTNTHRDTTVVCVVENVQDVLAIEATQQYNGVYHVLGGVISPIEGVGPNDIELASLMARVAAGGIEEIILALSATMEGDTTSFYIARHLAETDVRISTIARGIAIGEEIEYTDEVTLGRSIVNRVPYAKE